MLYRRSQSDLEANMFKVMAHICRCTTQIEVWALRNFNVLNLISFTFLYTLQLMEQRGYGEEYANRYKMMTRSVHGKFFAALYGSSWVLRNNLVGVTFLSDFTIREYHWSFFYVELPAWESRRLQHKFHRGWICLMSCRQMWCTNCCAHQRSRSWFLFSFLRLKRWMFLVSQVKFFCSTSKFLYSQFDPIQCTIGIYSCMGARLQLRGGVNYRVL